LVDHQPRYLDRDEYFADDLFAPVPHPKELRGLQNLRQPNRHQVVLVDRFDFRDENLLGPVFDYLAATIAILGLRNVVTVEELDRLWACPWLSLLALARQRLRQYPKTPFFSWEQDRLWPQWVQSENLLSQMVLTQVPPE